MFLYSILLVSWAKICLNLSWPEPWSKGPFDNNRKRVVKRNIIFMESLFFSIEIKQLHLKIYKQHEFCSIKGIWLPIRPNNSNTRQKGNMLNASSARIHITKNMTMRWKTVGIIALFNAVHLKMFVDIVAMSSCEKRVRFRRFWNYLKKNMINYQHFCNYIPLHDSVL